MKINVRTLVHVSVLIAAEVVLSRFCSISTPYVKIGFSFVPIALSAILYGPVWAGLVAGLADFLGAVLFPIGPYFPGFTVSAILTGVVFGLLLHNKTIRWSNLCAAVAINCLGVSLLLSTLWISILYGTPYLTLLPTRILQNVIMIPIQFIILRLLRRPIVLFAKKQRV